MDKDSVDSWLQQTKRTTWFSLELQTIHATGATALKEWVRCQRHTTGAINTWAQANISYIRQVTTELPTLSAAILNWTRPAKRWRPCSRSQRTSKRQAGRCLSTQCCQVWRTSRPQARTIKPNSTLFSEQQTKKLLFARYCHTPHSLIDCHC